MIPPEEPVKERKVKKAVEEPHENMGKLTEELRIDDDSDLDGFDEYPDDDDELEYLFEEDIICGHCRHRFIMFSRDSEGACFT